MMIMVSSILERRASDHPASRHRVTSNEQDPELPCSTPSPAELARRQSALAGLGPIRLAQIEARAPGMAERHAAAALQAVEQPRSSRSRLGIALRLVDEFDQAVAPVAACRRSCTHCCHIRVEMTQLEAERLGSAIGRAPNTRQRYMPAEEGAFGYDTPCPFLAEGECNIYEHRPFACRKHHSLDVDALFCRLDLPPEFAESVPRVSPNMALLAYAAAVTPSMGVADIRDWFPGSRELAHGPVGRIASARQTLEALVTERWSVE